MAACTSADITQPHLCMTAMSSIQDAEKGTWTGTKNKRPTIGVTSALKKNAQTPRRISEGEQSNGKEGCLGRRCKSYRRRAIMRAYHDSDMNNTSVLPGEISEPEISELVKTINLEDDSNEEEMQRFPDDGNEGRKGRCRHRNQDNNNTDQGEEGRSGRTTRKCRRKYGAQNESLGDNATEYQQTPTVGWEEENENESSLEEKRERRRRRKEYRRAMREESASGGHSDDNSERRCWRSLTIKVGMDGKVKPRRLARKLCKFLNQNEIDLNGYQPDENLKTMRGKGCRRGFDRRCREAHGCRGFRSSPPNYSRYYGPRPWRRRECPW